MAVYMVVTNDKLEMPVCIKDTGVEVAEWLGVDVDHVYSMISKKTTGKRLGYKVIRVDISKDDMGDQDKGI